MRVYISKFLLIFLAFIAIGLTGGFCFLIWLGYKFSGIRHQVSLGTSLLIYSIVALLFFAVILLWVKIIKSFLWRNTPIISFDDHDVSYWTRNNKEQLKIHYSEISKVEIGTVILSRGSQTFLQIHKKDGGLDNIFTNNLEKSTTEIFLMFKEKCAHLSQPYSAVLLLA